MSIATNYPHIEKPEGLPARLERFPRVRIAQIIMDHLAHGWTAEDIGRQYPHLSPAEVHSAFAYYFDNRDSVDREIEQELGDAKAMADTPHRSRFFLRLRAAGKL